MTKSSCAGKIRKFQQKFRKTVQNSLINWSIGVLDEAQGGCPVDTGKLKSSGLVSISRNTQTQFYMRIGFYANYALFVHEKNAYHKVGHSHFLIIPFNNQKGNLMSALRSDLKDIL